MSVSGASDTEVAPVAQAPKRARPTVDIIVNNYNYDRYLRAAVQSALDQTYQSVSVIVVDDGSTDNSRETIAAFGDSIVPVLQENGGQASAFNAGLERSRGDVVVFLDADDLLSPTAAERIAETFRARPDLAKIHYRLSVIDDAGRLTGEIKPPPHIPLPHGDLRTAMTRFPFDLARPATSGNAFSATVLRRIAPLPTERPVGADWYIVCLAPLHGPVGAIDEPLGSYRVHTGNWHAQLGTSLDLDHVRGVIARTQLARGYIERAAGQLGLPWDPRDASMCEIADRAISRKLDPTRHPVEDDTLLALVVRGTRAARRRFDVGPPMRITFVIWLVLLAVSPRGLARRLAEAFVFPERRRALNSWLAGLHRRR